MAILTDNEQQAWKATDDGTIITCIAVPGRAINDLLEDLEENDESGEDLKLKLQHKLDRNNVICWEEGSKPEHFLVSIPTNIYNKISKSITVADFEVVLKSATWKGAAVCPVIEIYYTNPKNLTASDNTEWGDTAEKLASLVEAFPEKTATEETVTVKNRAIDTDKLLALFANNPNLAKPVEFKPLDKTITLDNLIAGGAVEIMKTASRKRLDYNFDLVTEVTIRLEKMTDEANPVSNISTNDKEGKGESAKST